MQPTTLHLVTEAPADRPTPSDRATAGLDDILHLAELVPVLRHRLEIDDSMPDDAMLADLAMIAAHSAPRERWRAAFGSTLGTHLARSGRDLNTALNTLIALLPRPRM